MRRALASLVCLLMLPLSLTVHAQKLELIDEIPPPPPIQSGESFEPGVIIVRSEGKTVGEYRVAGELRAVRVEPDVGIVYYLLDADGDGRLDANRYSFAPDFWINSWTLFSW